MLSYSFILLLTSLFQSGAVRGVTVAQWSALNTTTGGHLFAADPFARPCYSVASAGGSFDSTECAAVQAGYTNERMLSLT